jgi:hypothetical protein
MAATWQLTESDPAVLSHYLWAADVKGFQVEEILALDPSFLQALKPIYALIFRTSFGSLL